MFRDFTKYEVYDDGRVWSYKSNKFLKPHLDKDGYYQIRLTDNEGKMKTYYLHRVVYEAVTSEPIQEGMQINHIDENKANNHISNLNLMSPKENCNWGTRNERIGNAQLGKHHTKERKENIRRGVLKQLGIDYERRKKAIDYLNQKCSKFVTESNQTTT